MHARGMRGASPPWERDRWSNQAARRPLAGTQSLSRSDAGCAQPKGLNVDSIRWEAQQLSEWKGLLAQNVPIARSGARFRPPSGRFGLQVIGLFVGILAGLLHDVEQLLDGFFDNSGREGGTPRSSAAPLRLPSPSESRNQLPVAEASSLSLVRMLKVLAGDHLLHQEASHDRLRESRIAGLPDVCWASDYRAMLCRCGSWSSSSKRS